MQALIASIIPYKLNIDNILPSDIIYQLSSLH